MNLFIHHFVMISVLCNFTICNIEKSVGQSFVEKLYHKHVFLQVYSYYRSLPMPVTSYKFGSIDPISGKEIDDDHGQFVSSVCWRGKSDMLIAANSSGCIKVLQMV